MSSFFIPQLKHSVADPRHFSVDPDPEADPDSAIFVINFQDANKKLIFQKVVLLITS
jgi:hypothetical protein